MDLQITGTNMEIPPRVQRYIESKFSKLTKHLPDIISVKVEVSEEGTKSPTQRYVIKAAVNSGAGSTIFHGEERAEDLLIATDRTVEVLTRQLEKRKGKLYDRHRGNEYARGKFTQPEPGPKAKKVVKNKRFVIEPMTREEAIDRMEELGHDFFLFNEQDTNELKLLYRRKDGDYGIIHPQVKKSEKLD